MQELARVDADFRSKRAHNDDNNDIKKLEAAISFIKRDQDDRPIAKAIKVCKDEERAKDKRNRDVSITDAITKD